MNNPFDLNEQYLMYLQRIGLTEAKMHPEQRKQLKQAFFGACGQILVMLNEDLAPLDEPTACKKLEDMQKQVGEFFISQVIDHQAKHN